MSEKVLGLCKNFLDSHSKEYEKNNEQQDKWGVGCYFEETSGKKRSFYFGLNSYMPAQYFFSVDLYLSKIDEQRDDWYSDGEWAYFPLDKEILAKCGSDEDLQVAFNKNVEEVIASIDK